MAQKPVPPPPTRYGAGGTAQAKNTGYRLVLGAYMHPEAGRLPASLAGHGFVAIERPDGQRQAFGFSPANYGGMDPRRDLARLNAGVPGKVHADSQAFGKPGVVTRSVAISPVQAQAALAKVAEYSASRRSFSATRAQCTDFAKDVARAAGIDAGPARGPRAFYESLRRQR